MVSPDFDSSFGEGDRVRRFLRGFHTPTLTPTPLPERARGLCAVAAGGVALGGDNPKFDPGHVTVNDAHRALPARALRAS
ncbi:MAG TPA: hypothetical protein PKK06_11760 [Phycisphaerae bacterium]|nr:hypothetical protein [Phycisphaerae bacterium]HNU45863.1 hypothetical protein [Phycisphaerae bacterium]